MNKHEEQEWLKQNPGSDINDYREKKKNSRKKNDDGGLGALKDQREKLLKDDQTVVNNYIFNHPICRHSRKLKNTSLKSETKDRKRSKRQKRKEE